MKEWKETLIDAGNGEIPEEVKKHRYWRIELTADPDQGMTIAWYVADTRFESMDEGERQSALSREKYFYLWNRIKV